MKITVPKILDLKKIRQISMMTAYDFPTANAVSEAGIDIILVGDSLAQVVLGHDDTLSVTMDEMLHHVKAVTRAQPNSLVVADMPYMSYHNTVEEAVRNAARFIQEAGADAVKLEGGHKRKNVIKAIINAEIPVMGHLGLTPQSKNIMGGYRIQGKTLGRATKLLEEAVLLDSIGCFSMVLEGLPSVVAEVITEKITIPTIGIGAGVDVSGQVLVFNDLIGMKSKEYIDAKFVKRYSNQYEEVVSSLKQYKEDVENKIFPSEEHSYSAEKLTPENIKEWKKEIKKILS